MGRQSERPAPRALLGKRGENIACEYLVSRGYTIIDRNWRCRTGEIDIVARHANTLVVVEVKARSSVSAGHPFDAITALKYARLRTLAGYWCAEHDVPFANLRIDGIAVLISKDRPATVEHLTGISR